MIILRSTKHYATIFCCSYLPWKRNICFLSSRENLDFLGFFSPIMFFEVIDLSPCFQQQRQSVEACNQAASFGLWSHLPGLWWSDREAKKRTCINFVLVCVFNSMALCFKLPLNMKAVCRRMVSQPVGQLLLKRCVEIWAGMFMPHMTTFLIGKFLAKQQDSENSNRSKRFTYSEQAVWSTFSSPWWR